MNIAAILFGSKIKQATTSRIQDQFNAIQKEYIWELPLPVEFLFKREKPPSLFVSFSQPILKQQKQKQNKESTTKPSERIPRGEESSELSSILKLVV